jgi:peptidoglycan/xylan/chitin deacetylase (PgdA/CDA1 family)
MYHQVAPAGPDYLARNRIRPDVFEEQLRYLHDEGFHTIDLEEWRRAIQAQEPIPGRAVILTFEDGYLDFKNYAWPLLQRYGFSATVFLIAERIGQSGWDQIYGEEVPLVGWKDIHQLQDEGVEFGSHSAVLRWLTELSFAEVVSEGARSRAILERGLKRPVTAFAYPHGAEDQVVQHLIGACGYVFGLSCQPGPSKFYDPLLALPRIEIMGSDGLEKVITKIGIQPESADG